LLILLKLEFANQKVQRGWMVRGGDTKGQATTLITGFAVIVCYAFVFLPFLPGRHGLLGYDYGFTLPQLLDNYIWFKKNGFFAVYWFSPSFCGGIPVFPHPASCFYSIPQFLTFCVGPLPAVGLSFLIFAALGYSGFYLLIRRACKCSKPVAFLCGVLFLFNGFYWSKALMGAFIYSSFMLVPWVVMLLLLPSVAEGERQGGQARNILLAGFAVSYMVYSGMQTFLPAEMLAIMLAGFLSCLLYPDRFPLKAFAGRFAGACLIAFGLSAAKLSAVYHFTANFPRDYYPLPQFKSFLALLKVVVGSLWGSPVDDFARKMIVNTPFLLGRHEFEFCVGPVPFVVIGVAAVVFIFRYLSRPRAGLIGLRRALLLMVTCVLVGVPLALNFYTPAWNAFLKQLPVIRNSSQCVRWFAVYIPALVLLTGVAMERIVRSRRLCLALALAGVGSTIIFNMAMDRTYYYLQQSYSGVRVQKAFLAIKRGSIDPHITHISIAVDGCGRPGEPIYRNDAFVYNQSQFLCYEPSFGYGLEKLPFGRLHVGPVMDVTDRFFNIKNPACYVFPDANGCRPGDHFTVDQREQVVAFTHYRPFSFSMPPVQKAANIVTICCLILCTVFLARDGARRALRRLNTGRAPVEGDSLSR